MITKIARAACMITIGVTIGVAVLAQHWDAAIFFLLALHFYFEDDK